MKYQCLLINLFNTCIFKNFHDHSQLEWHMLKLIFLIVIIQYSHQYLMAFMQPNRFVNK